MSSAASLTNRDDVADADPEILAPLSRLQSLWLINLKKITEAGLPDFSRFAELSSLHLEGTSVTGACLAPFRGVKRLKFLNLSGTPIDDAGLSNLAGNEIAELYLHGTKVGDASASLLR